MKQSTKLIGEVFLVMLVALVAPALVFADVDRRTLNNGNLVLEDIPEIPRQLFLDLYRYQNVRAASFRAWTADSNGVYVSTGFGDVDSIHRVDMPLGARRQITFYEEPIGGIAAQPGANQLLFTRDAGGSEFAQIFKLNHMTGEAQMLTDGESRNNSLLWDRRGTRVAYQSTRRNGRSNDLWVMDPDEPEGASVVLESPGGSYWSPTEFSASGSKLLASNYISAADSRVSLIDLDTGSSVLLAGGAENPSTNFPIGFDDAGDGLWFITDQGSEQDRVAWRSLEPDAEIELVSADIPWGITAATISEDRRRLAFITNEDGMSRMYLLDTATREYRQVEGLPTGVIYGIQFSPNSRRLGMTINTPQTPSDTFVLELGAGPSEYTELVRWTESEVGGLDTSAFSAPELVRYPTFDDVDGKPRKIPAWVFRPSGKGPHPVVISIHGGPEGQSRPTFSSTFQMWVDKLGAAVIRPNVRGSRGYGKTYMGLDNGFDREDSVKDIGALLDWIETQPDLDANRVAVSGGSYGGYMVLACAVHYSDKLRAVVDVVGISNFVTFLENTQDYRRDQRREEYGDERDPKMRAHLERISPLNNVDKMNVPMFIVQGENDPRVPVTEASQMVEALRDQGHKVWYMNALNEGHGYRKRENRDVYQQATILFLQQHLADD